MSCILTMPRLGETMDEGRLSAWLVEPGQSFKRGDPILEVETDKTMVEYPALGSGTLVKSLVEIGEMIEVGAPIAEIELDDGLNWLSDGNADRVKEPTNIELTQTSISRAPATRTTGEKLRATPVARRLAKRNNIDLDNIVGTGRRGRIERKDVESAIQLGSSELHTKIHTNSGVVWCEKGPTEGSPILFIHGIAADHTAWAGLQSQMARSGYRTIAIDLPSHGVSTIDARSVAELTSPVIEFAEKAISSQPIHIVAHSMGALVSVVLAKSIPIASLTLIAPAGLGRTINTNFLNTLSAPRDVASVARVLTWLTHSPNGLSEAAHQAIFETLRKGRITELARSLAGTSGLKMNICDELSELAEDITVSLLIGHQDQIIDWSETIEVSELVSVHHFPDAGHMPHWEAQAKVKTILERKIAK